MAVSEERISGDIALIGAHDSGRVPGVGEGRIPGPREWPLLGWRGNFLPLLRDPIGHMLRLREAYGDVVSLGRADTEYIFVFSPEYNHQVLSDQDLFYNGEINAPGSLVNIPEGTPAYHLLSGITTMNGARHRRQRRLLMPAFHKKRVEALRDNMAEIIGRHLDGWWVGSEIDLLREMKVATLEVALRTILGLEPGPESDDVRLLMDRWLRLALSFPVVALPFDVPGLPFHRMLAQSAEVEREIRAMIRKRRAELERSGDHSAPDALSLLLQARDEEGVGLTEDQLIGQTTALFIAGHETTASALTWTLFLLAQHPVVYSDLMEELRGELGGEAPTVEQLGRLPLLDAVINESMRLFPPGLWFLRVATKPVSFGRYTVPEGTRILWSPVATHRLPELYPEPNRFLPERWRTINPSPYEYLPFGAGPRRCLGATFATMELKMALPLILQRYRLELLPGTKVDLASSPLAAPRGGMPVRIGKPKGKPYKVEVGGNIRSFVDLG